MIVGLRISLVLNPIGQPTPIDGADVLQALDDWYRFGRRADDVKPSSDAEWIELLERSVSIGERDSNLQIREFRFGSPFTLTASIPIEVYAAAPAALWVLIAGVERLFNFKQHVRTERAESRAREAESELQRTRAEIERLQLAEQYWSQRLSQSGRHLQGEPAPPEFQGEAGWLDWDDGTSFP